MAILSEEKRTELRCRVIADLARDIWDEASVALLTLDTLERLSDRIDDHLYGGIRAPRDITEAELAAIASVAERAPAPMLVHVIDPFSIPDRTWCGAPIDSAVLRGDDLDAVVSRQKPEPSDLCPRCAQVLVVERER